MPRIQGKHRVLRHDSGSSTLIHNERYEACADQLRLAIPLAYRTGISRVNFVAAGPATVTLALVTVSDHALVSAWMHPTEATQQQ